jgi:hypothetical protein
MIDDMMRSADFALPPLEGEVEVSLRDRAASGKLATLTQAESNGARYATFAGEPVERWKMSGTVVGITGTGARARAPSPTSSSGAS